MKWEKSEATLPSTEKQLHPAVKSWLDNVLIPAMVKLYREENGVGGDRIPTKDNEE